MRIFGCLYKDNKCFMFLGVNGVRRVNYIYINAEIKDISAVTHLHLAVGCLLYFHILSQKDCRISSALS